MSYKKLKIRITDTNY